MNQLRKHSFPDLFFGALAFMTLVYHGAVRDVRRGKGSALQALLMEVFQAATVVIFFYALITILGMKGSAVRGSFVLYVLYSAD